jgi:hypothetical protein
MLDSIAAIAMPTAVAVAGGDRLVDRLHIAMPALVTVTLSPP